jgi:hypothetical protein
MEYRYTGKIWLSDLKGANGEFADQSDVMDNTLDKDVTELVKSSDTISESLSEAIISITNEFDGYESEEDYLRDNGLDEDDDYDDEDEGFGNEGYWHVEVITNRKLTDEELKFIEEWYHNDGDYFWADMFEDLELTLES